MRPQTVFIAAGISMYQVLPEKPEGDAEGNIPYRMKETQHLSPARLQTPI